MGTGRKIEHLFPFLFNYNRLRHALSDSLSRPLLDDGDERNDGRVEQNHDVLQADPKRKAELEKEVHKLKSELSKIQSQLATISKPPKPQVSVVDKGQEESKEIEELKSRVAKLESNIAEIKELKSRVAKLESSNNQPDTLMKKQQKAIEELRKGNSAMAKKIAELIRTSTAEEKFAELTAQVAELKSRSLMDSAETEIPMDNLLRFLISVLVFFVAFLIGSELGRR